MQRVYILENGSYYGKFFVFLSGIGITYFVSAGFQIVWSTEQIQIVFSALGTRLIINISRRMRMLGHAYAYELVRTSFKQRHDNRS